MASGATYPPLSVINRYSWPGGLHCLQQGFRASAWVVLKTMGPGYITPPPPPPLYTFHRSCCIHTLSPAKSPCPIDSPQKRPRLAWVACEGYGVQRLAEPNSLVKGLEFRAYKGYIGVIQGYTEEKMGTTI